MGKPNISEHDGVRNLHFGTPVIQGAMRLDDSLALEFEYIQQMMLWALFIEQPAHIVQLGLGAGALTKFCHYHYPAARTTAIELNPAVITECHTHFALPSNDQRLSVCAMDAWDYVNDQANHSSCDVLQVDLYDAQAIEPTLNSPEFYAACADCLTDNGIMTVNIFCDQDNHSHNLEAIEHSFSAVAWLPEVHDSNVVAVAFKNAPSIDFDQLYAQAKRIEQQLKLPAKSWVDGLMLWMQG
ncbi:MAG: methyltransferase [Alcaligenaceae bacterium]